MSPILPVWRWRTITEKDDFPLEHVQRLHFLRLATGPGHGGKPAELEASWREADALAKIADSL